MKKAITILMALTLGFSNIAWAAEEIPAKTLGELLDLVKDGKVVNTRTNDRREKEFIAAKAQQQQAVRNAERMQREEEAEAERLENIFEKNEANIAAQQEILAKRLGSLREYGRCLRRLTAEHRGRGGVEVPGNPLRVAMEFVYRRDIEALPNGIGNSRLQQPLLDVVRGLFLAHRLREKNDVEAPADRSDRPAAGDVVGRGDQQAQRTA